MKMRVWAVAVLGFALGVVPVQAGLFGGRTEKKLPQAPRAFERVGHYREPVAKAKPRNSADRQGAGHEPVRRLEQRPIIVTHPYVRDLR